MKVEGDLNNYLARQFKKRYKTLNYLKASDKYSIGVSDFLMWRGGRGAAMEVKFIKDWPKRDGTKLLSHPFGGTQLTFLKRMDMVHSPAFGLVGVGSEKSLYLIEYYQIPESGNWPKLVFREAGFPCYPIGDVDALLEGIFAPEIQYEWR